MKQAILLLSNKTDMIVRERYDKLIREYGHKADVYLLYDNSNGMGDDACCHFNSVYSFTSDSLIMYGYDALRGGFLGNCHYPVLRFLNDYPDYDYCWTIEDDVTFSGNWSVFFDAFADSDSDLIAAKVRRFENEPNWYWWNSLFAPLGIDLKRDEMYASFIPIYRMSSKAIKCLEGEMRKGWRGHFEGVIPTVLMMNGMKMLDINENSQNINFYTEGTHSWMPLVVQNIKQNMIYHPLKEKRIDSTGRKCCLLSVVHDSCVPKSWSDCFVERNYDIHLIVNSSSYGKYYDYADFVYNKNGTKGELIKDYFDSHDGLVDEYDYFFVIDEQCTMKVNQINELFEDMKINDNEFALVGLSMPCFRKDAMKQILIDNPEGLILYF